MDSQSKTSVIRIRNRMNLPLTRPREMRQIPAARNPSTTNSTRSASGETYRILRGTSRQSIVSPDHRLAWRRYRQAPSTSPATSPKLAQRNSRLDAFGSSPGQEWLLAIKYMLLGGRESLWSGDLPVVKRDLRAVPLPQGSPPLCLLPRRG